MKSKKINEYILFKKFFKELMDNLTKPITLFAFFTLIISNLFLLTKLNEDIELIIGNVAGTLTLTIVIYSSYFFLLLIGIYTIIKIVDVEESLEKINNSILRVSGLLITTILFFGILLSYYWMVVTFDAQAKEINIKSVENKILIDTSEV